jgi:putative ABC transport system substrate-binding protein
MIRRREFVAGLGGAAAWPVVARAQTERVRLVGVLFGGDATSLFLTPFREEMAKLGWVEGRNLRIDYRESAGDPALIAANAEALVNLHPDVIVPVGGPAIRAVETRTQIIPIVFGGGGDAVDNRFATSVARPVGNVTGFANVVTSLGGKWLELLKEAVPHINRVASIFTPDESAGPLPKSPMQAAIDGAAAQLAILLIRMPLRDPVETERAISAFAAEPNGGLLLTGAAPPPATYEALRRLALQYRLPLMYGVGRVVRDGVLMSHGGDLREAVHGMAFDVDRVLRGAKPSDLPIQYPTKFQLVVNLKTAKAIGLTIPESFLLLRADEVIE